MVRERRVTVAAAALVVASFALAAAVTGCGAGEGSAPAASPSPTRSGALPTASGGLIVFDGDSLTEGYFLTEAQSYPAHVMEQLPAKLGWTNVAVSGQTWPDLLADVNLEVDPLYRPQRAVNVVVVWAGANDLASGYDAREIFDNARAYCEARRRVGFTVVTLTMYPAEPVWMDQGFEMERREYNELLRTHWPEFADALVDVAADERIGDRSPASREDYFLDVLHLNEDGYKVIADCVVRTLRTLLPSS